MPGHRHPDDVHRRAFPGEGEAEFRELCEFVRTAQFDNLGAFTYSPEPGSGLRAARATRSRRRRRSGGKDFLLSLQRPIARAEEPRAARAGPSRRSSRARARRPSTSSRGACAPRRPRSTAASSINDAGGRDVRPGRDRAGPDLGDPRLRPRRRDRLNRTTALRSRSLDQPDASGLTPCTSSAILSARPTCRAAGIATIGNFDGVHLGHRRILEDRRRPGAGGRPRLGRDHVRAAPARGPPPRPRAAPHPDAAPEGGGDRGARDRDAPRHPVHARLLADRAGGVRAGVPGRAARRLGDLPRAALRLRPRQARRPRPLEAHGSGVRVRRRRASRRSSTRASRSLRRGSATPSSAERSPSANAMLGREYELDGLVAKGDKVGHKIGYPTINLEPENELPSGRRRLRDADRDPLLRPAVRLRHEHRPPPHRSTRTTTTTIETFVLDFSSNVYGEKVRLFFFDRLREERKFPSVDGPVGADRPRHRSRPRLPRFKETGRRITREKPLRIHQEPVTKKSAGEGLSSPALFRSSRGLRS